MGTTLEYLRDIRSNYIKENWNYKRVYWNNFQYAILDNCIFYESTVKNRPSYNDITMMIDTETSKPDSKDVIDNHIVIWTLSIRLFDINIATLYGRKPSELMQCIETIHNHLKGAQTAFYVFNLGYDYVFLRKFFFKQFGFPVSELNVKPHQPIVLKFENGIIIKDALILAQCKLEKWAKDLNVEHQKASGDWDYNIIRHQNSDITDEELHYAEYDTLAGVECLDTLKNQLHKNIGTMPFTSTGILRELIAKEGAKNHAKDWFRKNCPTFKQYQKLTKVYHGGYTHGNRAHLEEKITTEKYGDDVLGGDFASSYPFVLFLKYPSGKFVELDNKSMDFIIKNADKYAFMFKLIATNIRLKDDCFPMPYLQYSKCEYTINALVDNGRILAADYVEIYLNEVDLMIIAKQYQMHQHICVEVEACVKEYLPRWFTDIVFQLFKDKTALKGVDKVRYTIAKYKLNACYGLCCQRWDKRLIIETLSGEYEYDDSLTDEEIFNKTIKKRSTILPYQVGVWCTSYAAYNLFQMGSMCKIWLYSDTDSCYGIHWDMKRVQSYNQRCIDFIKERGYSGVLHNNRYYHLGIIEFDDESVYTEFKYMGAKRYCGRCKDDNKLHITVAGVPKSNGAKCLKDDIANFHRGFVFDGLITKKLTHKHIYIDEIYINEYGDEVGDSIDLSPCDYELDATVYHSLDEYIEALETVQIQLAEDIDDLNLVV